MAAAEVTLLIKPTEFFREKVSSALDRQKLRVSEEVEFYLVNLLCDFIAPSKLQAGAQGIDLLNTPLALILKTALEAPPEEQVKIYKVLGDTSLYMSGYFQDYFNRKTFDVDYYISLGANAYSSVSNLIRERTKEKRASLVFENLSLQFAQFVEVMAEVSDLLGSSQSSSLLAIYERWTRNQSERLRRKLEDSGITPIPSNTKVKQ